MEIVEQVTYRLVPACLDAHTLVRAMLCSIALALTPFSGAQRNSAAAQAEARSIAGGAFTFTLLRTNFRDPIFNEPGGGVEVVSRTTAAGFGVRAGYMRRSEHISGAISASYYRNSFADFGYTDETGREFFYEDPRITLAFADLSLHLQPTQRLPVAAFALLGLGCERERFVLDSEDSTQAGQVKSARYRHSYGLGVSIGLVRHLNAVAEWRAIPGDLRKVATCEIEECGTSGDCWGTGEYYDCEKTANFAHVLSIGLDLRWP